MLNAAALLRSAIAAAFEERDLPFHPSRLTLGALAPAAYYAGPEGKTLRAALLECPPQWMESCSQEGGYLNFTFAPTLLETLLRQFSEALPPARFDPDWTEEALFSPLPYACARLMQAARKPGRELPQSLCLRLFCLADWLDSPRLQQKAPACAADFSQSAASLRPSLLEAASRAFCALQAGGQVF